MQPPYKQTNTYTHSYRWDKHTRESDRKRHITHIYMHTHAATASRCVYVYVLCIALEIYVPYVYLSIYSFIRSTLFRVSFRNLSFDRSCLFSLIARLYALLPYFSFIGEREPKCRSWRSGWKGDRNGFILFFSFPNDSKRTFVCIRSFGLKLSPFHILSHSAVDCFSSTFVWLLVCRYIFFAYNCLYVDSLFFLHVVVDQHIWLKC